MKGRKKKKVTSKPLLVEGRLKKYYLSTICHKYYLYYIFFCFIVLYCLMFSQQYSLFFFRTRWQKKEKKTTKFCWTITIALIVINNACIPNHSTLSFYKQSNTNNYVARLLKQFIEPHNEMKKKKETSFPELEDPAPNWAWSYCSRENFVLISNVNYDPILFAWLLSSRCLQKKWVVFFS